MTLASLGECGNSNKKLFCVFFVAAAGGGFGAPQTPSSSNPSGFGTPTAGGSNPFNAATPSTPQNMFSLGTTNTAPRPRAAASRTARRRTNKR